MEKLCPMPDETGKRGPCIENRCRWYIQLLGKNPQKDAPIEEWNCAISYLPILLIENAQQTRQFAASTDSARNEARKDAAAITAGLVEIAQAAAVARPHRHGDNGMAVDALPWRPAPGFFGRLRLVFKGGK